MEDPFRRPEERHPAEMFIILQAADPAIDQTIHLLSSEALAVPLYLVELVDQGTMLLVLEGMVLQILDLEEVALGVTPLPWLDQEELLEDMLNISTRHQLPPIHIPSVPEALVVQREQVVRMEGMVLTEKLSYGSIIDD